MTVGLFTDVYNQFAPLAEKYNKIGRNTGNILFVDALKSVLDCIIVRDWEKDKLAQCSAFITAELIWLREGMPPRAGLLSRLEATRGKPLVPISIGLQAGTFKADFQLHPEMVAVIKELEARCKLAVRGAYTAEIFARHGIRNLEVIGCPSIYQIPLYQESLAFLQKPGGPSESIVANFRTFAGKLSEREIDILRHMTRHSSSFVEQTLMSLADTNVTDEKLIEWFDRNSHLFFDLESWLRHNRRHDFSYGLRFHGNVAAMLAGMRALFVVIDSRTKEMTSHFRLPTLDVAKFHPAMTMDDLCAVADFGDFARVYADRLETFIGYIEGNGLTLSDRFKNSLSRFKRHEQAAEHSPGSSAAATRAACLQNSSTPSP